jgi:glutamate racemase
MELVEREDDEGAEAYLRRLLAEWELDKVDAVVLGCTHFPLIARQVREAMGEGVRIVSSAEETCREVRETLARRGELAPSESADCGVLGEPLYRFATTSDDITAFAVSGKFIFGHQLDSIEHVNLDAVVPLPDV